MTLNNFAEIIQGNIPTRIEVNEGKPIETITMQELNYNVNTSDDIPEKKFIKIQSDKLSNYSLTKEKDIVVGLSSGKAMVIEKERANKLILSNLAIIRIYPKADIDPYYLCWYINSNTMAIKKLLQGTAAVFIIPLNVLKSFDIEVISLHKQQLIGKIYELNRKRERLNKIIEQKKSEVLSYRLMLAYKIEKLSEEK